MHMPVKPGQGEGMERTEKHSDRSETRGTVKRRIKSSVPQVWYAKVGKQGAAGYTGIGKTGKAEGGGTPVVKV